RIAITKLGKLKPVTSQPNSRLLRYPPTTAPTMPSAVVITNPWTVADSPGLLPGMMYWATAPAIRPNKHHSKMLTIIILPSPNSPRGCGARPGVPVRGPDRPPAGMMLRAINSTDESLYQQRQRTLVGLFCERPDPANSPARGSASVGT